MKIYRYLVLGLALIGLTIVAEAQNPLSQNTDALRSAPAPALSGIVGIDAQAPEEDLSSNLPQIPAMLGGKGTSLAFQSEMERSNYLRGGLNVGAAYDDNALLGMGAGTNGTVGNTSYSVFSSLAIEQSWSRARWTLAYAGGLTVNQRITDRNQGSHDVNFDSQFRLSPHVNLRIAEDFAKQKSIYVLRQAPDRTQKRIPFNYKEVIKGKNPEQNIRLQTGDTVVVP